MDPITKNYLQDNCLILDISSIPDLYICPICNKLISEPKLSNCGCSYCKTCITDNLKDGDKCKRCDHQIYVSQIIDNTRLVNEIPDSFVYCPNLYCSNYLPIKELVGHLGNCNLQGSRCIMNKIGCFRQLKDVNEIQTHLVSDITFHFKLLMENLNENSISIDNMKNNNYEYDAKFDEMKALVKNGSNEITLTKSGYIDPNKLKLLEKQMINVYSRTDLLKDELTKGFQNFYFILSKENLIAKSEKLLHNTTIHTLCPEQSPDTENWCSLWPEFSTDDNSLDKKPGLVNPKESLPETTIHSLHQEQSFDTGNSLSLHPELSPQHKSTDDNSIGSLKKSTMNESLRSKTIHSLHQERSSDTGNSLSLHPEVSPQYKSTEDNSIGSLKDDLLALSETMKCVQDELKAEKLKTKELENDLAVEKSKIVNLLEKLIMEKSKTDQLVEDFYAEKSKTDKLNEEFNSKLIKLKEEIDTDTKQRYNFLNDLTMVQSQIGLLKEDSKRFTKKFSSLEIEHIKINEKVNEKVKDKIEIPITGPEPHDIFQYTFTYIKPKNNSVRYYSDTFNIRSYKLKVAMDIWIDGDIIFSVLLDNNDAQFDQSITVKFKLQVTDDKKGFIHGNTFNLLDKQKLENKNQCIYSTEFLKVQSVASAVSITIELLS